MELGEAVDRVLLGESMRAVAEAHREHVLASLGMEPDEVNPRARWEDTDRFMKVLCRELGDRHAGDSRVAAALSAWAHRVDDYEAFDALLANFHGFEGHGQLLRRGRQLFPGPLTAHWESEA
jgi:hypothetical protein